MNYKMIGRFIAQILTVEGVFMLPALGISIFYGEKSAIAGFLWTLLVLVPLIVALFMLCKKSKTVLFAREGFLCVGISWVILSLIGCLPFFFSREIPSFIDAFFETVSGFTTTGASILGNVEALSRGLLYWRSFGNWLGGMGVLVFLLALTPSNGQGSGFTMHLLRAESPGPDVGKLVPKMRSTAMILYLIYIFLTLIYFAFLLVGDMAPLDAVCTALSTAGTGGFGIRNDGMASFSPYIQNVTSVFLLLFGINFSCYYLLLLGKIKSVFRDEELRLYLGIVLCSVLLIAWNLGSTYATTGETFRHSLFQVASIVTTAGFSTADFNLWPSFSKAILLGLMFLGACAGSTAGGFKCTRLLIIFKNLRRNIQKTVRPQKVLVVRNNKSAMSESVVESTNAYLAAYVLILLFSFLAISLDNFSVETNATAVLSCFNNIGPGLGDVGPMGNYAAYSIFSKLVLCFDMLAGRLEIFPMLILFSGFHRKNR